MKKKSWLIFLGMGTLFLAFSVHNMVVIPLFHATDHWSWLTNDTDVINYIKFYFLIQGVWQLAFALLVLVVTVTGYRHGQRWAWYNMWVIPLLLLGISVAMYWLLPITVVMIAIAITALLSSRSLFFQPRVRPV